MDGILLVLRTGMQWSALDHTKICTSSAAYRRFREWLEAGMFQALRESGLLECEALSRIDWGWMPEEAQMANQSVNRDNWYDRSIRPRQRWRRAPPVVGP